MKTINPVAPEEGDDGFSRSFFPPAATLTTVQSVTATDTILGLAEMRLAHRRRGEFPA